jgi:hypothetical protein
MSFSDYISLNPPLNDEIQGRWEMDICEGACIQPY